MAGVDFAEKRKRRGPNYSKLKMIPLNQMPGYVGAMSSAATPTTPSARTTVNADQSRSAAERGATAAAGAGRAGGVGGLAVSLGGLGARLLGVGGSADGGAADGGAAGGGVGGKSPEDAQRRERLMRALGALRSEGERTARDGTREGEPHTHAPRETAAADGAAETPRAVVVVKSWFAERSECAGDADEERRASHVTPSLAARP